jgi:hypothetical protein
MANSAVTLLRRADAAQADPPERTWMSLTRLKTARFGDSIPSLPTAPSPVGSAGPRSALGPCHNGRARTPAVANRSEHLQVVDLPAKAAAMMQVGDSDCGPDGREGSSASPVTRAGTDESPDRPVEGRVNHIKMLKRQTYGRAGLPLLRKRVLLTAAGGSRAGKRAR